MHPYRTSWVPPAREPVSDDAGALKIALGVLAFVSAIQVATALLHTGPFADQTVFGILAFGFAVAGLRRHAGASVTGSRMR